MSKIAGKAPTVFQSILCLLLLLVIATVSFGTLFAVDLSFDTEVRERLEWALDGMQDGNGNGIAFSKQIEISLPYVADSAGDAAELAQVLLDVSDNPDANRAEQIAVQKQEVVDLAMFFVMLSVGFSENWICAFLCVLLVVLIVLIPIGSAFSALKALFAFFYHLHRPGRGFYKISKAFSRVMGVFPFLLLLMLMMPTLHLGQAMHLILLLCGAALLLSLIVSRVKYYGAFDRRYRNIQQLMSLFSIGAWLFFWLHFVSSGMLETVAELLANDSLETLWYTATDFSDWQAALPVWLLFVFVIATIAVFSCFWQSLAMLSCMSRSRSDTHLILCLAAPIMAAIPYVLSYLGYDLTPDASVWSEYGLAAVGLLSLYGIELVKKIMISTLCKSVKHTHRWQIVTGGYVYEGLGEDEM